jgi:hypothetical protein
MFFHNRFRRSIAAGAAALVLAGGAVGIVSATSNTSGGSATAAQVQPVGGGSNARSGPAAGGTSGKVTSVTASGLKVKTSAGQTVTVKTTSTTAYRRGTKSASKSAVAAGQPVLVLGTVSGTTITASHVTVQPKSTGAAPAWAGKVVPFQRGTQSASKSVGQVPADYQQGSGTLVSGTAANKATQAALAVYPGGIVDRVVLLSNGEYEVHNIGVNWPHHIFVSHDFKVVGAE